MHESGNLRQTATAGVSLHCHTQYSKENLDFLPHYAKRIPVIAGFFNRECKLYRKREGRCIDWTTAYWTPPMTPKLVYETEAKQINDAGLDAIVSITDHDCIEANLAVSSSKAPISMEWTVPFDCGFFHLGIHNMPAERATEITDTLLTFTFDPSRHSTKNLDELFAMLEEIPGILIVFNHPLWDIERVGKQMHGKLLADFLRLHGRWMHALEINGFRSWSENKAVIEIAESLDLPIVAGGDRHGCQPNTIINISDCGSFDEYAETIRTTKRSDVVLMPAYERPILSRQLRSFAEIVGHYPQFADGRQLWMDRIFFDLGDGFGLRSLSEHGMIRGPLWLRMAVRTLGILGNPKLAVLFRLARGKADRVPAAFDNEDFVIHEIDDLAGNLSSEPVL